MELKRVLIMAGGTGGHVFPALAIAKKLMDEGCQILWLGTRGRMEEQLVPKYGIDIEYIDVKGIRKNGVRTKLSAPFMVLKAVLQAKRVIKKFRPQVVLGMGGYASGPGGVAAYLQGIPVVLHEQNAKAGLTNRLLFKIAKRALLGFPGAFTGSKVTVVGNPVRESIVKLNELVRDFTLNPLKISIIGGSLGARALNEIVPEALMNFKSDSIKVVHQCGKGNSENVKKAYQKAAFDVSVSDFVDDMDDLYKNTDLIICRAGALTVAEVTCAGVPAIFVPLPTAVDDHQYKNASFVQKEGGAVIFRQHELTSEILFNTINDLNNNRAKLEQMSQNAKHCAKLNATEKAVEIIKELV
ncbi:undecaprenyldiphospho-muramoylpentapeptide beta-N-acetylglucosaminyltransferase [Succinivibrio faecicola]|uniref:UDP-N-acetylglucosamine--N-acetylmuramyl-(pentapeptide) pyrophosphoryl-undecaprenol N-acetylglucosamine transferase n=2 Tax=Succinivibrio TaxID=83770 RepID=A0ABS7DFN4_9GAMM|nr:undecaprenyldiphospho-muramoylpentapeptide beta-N-acetylglucosaminyltransferase [Succinivibrio faecicola]MBW7570118.1 undecaprenyldiphospho-muramoylpentapeptide beta-N-acetylglucosaminyltransferase [Succinivibrio faecicola]MCI6938786.1 undecaprenyldiphospho-muramoylpentapeptide beta-N-acetylglucosaminyltransferase [Succinatimonas hippei]